MCQIIQKNIEIGILLYPHVQMATVLGLTDLFKIANQIQLETLNSPLKTIKITYWELDENTLKLQKTYDTKPNIETIPDIIIIPSSLEKPISSQQAQFYSSWLCDLHFNGTTLISVCAGIFLLAETNLIDGQTVTLHWHHKDLFEKNFKNIKVDIDQLIVDNGSIITAGGIMAWIDLGLMLVTRSLCEEIMIKTAQMLLVDPSGRQQSYYRVFSPKFNHGDEAILKVQNWLQDNNNKHMTLASLAEYACMEPRTFLRRFKKATGMTSAEYCQRLRINYACKKLQSTHLSIDQIAWEVAYKDTSSFRRIFKRIMRLTPSEYRQRFNPSYID